jgi:hypothetical protein
LEIAVFQHSKTLVSSIGLVVSLSAAAWPSAAASLPAVQHAGSNTFMTGGIGLDESNALKAAMKHWPLTMLFAENAGKRAEYVANVRVEVTGPKGQTAIETVTQGPYLLADLRPGAYQVAATLDHKTLHRVVAVKPGKPVEVTFVWPAHAATTH